VKSLTRWLWVSVLPQTTTLRPKTSHCVISISSPNINIYISHGSVVAQLRCGELLNIRFNAHCPQSVHVKGFENWLILKGKGKGTFSSLWINPRQSYGASPAIWDHTVLPATRHRWARPALTPATQAGTRFTYPGGMEGWVDLVTGKRSRRESNSRPLGPESNALTTEPPSKYLANIWKWQSVTSWGHSVFSATDGRTDGRTCAYKA